MKHRATGCQTLVLKHQSAGRKWFLIGGNFLQTDPLVDVAVSEAPGEPYPLTPEEGSVEQEPVSVGSSSSFRREADKNGKQACTHVLEGLEL